MLEKGISGETRADARSDTDMQIVVLDLLSNLKWRRSSGYFCELVKQMAALHVGHFW